MFTKGQSGNPRGRPKGCPNKTTQSVKEAICQAFDEVGGVNFLVGLAKKDPKTFAKLLGRIIPTEVQGAVEGLVVKLITFGDKETKQDGNNNSE